MDGMRPRSVVAGALLAVVLSCAPAVRVSGPTPTDVPAASNGASPIPTRIPTTDRVTIRENAGGPNARLVVRSAATGEQLRDLSDGALLPDGRTVLAVDHVAFGNALLRAVDRTTGTTVRSLELPSSSWSLRYTNAGHGGLSANGKWLGLVGSAYNATDTAGKWTAHSTFGLLDTALTSPPRVIALGGSYILDSVSDDGRSLYLVQNDLDQRNVPAGHATLRVYDVAAGTFADIGGDRLPSLNAFRADPIGVGAFAYSLIVFVGDAPYLVRLDADARSARVLRIPTEKLTTSSPNVPPGELSLLWSLVATRSGATLYAVNGALGVVNEIDVASFTVRRTAMVSASAGTGPLSAVLRWLAPVADAKMIVRSGTILSRDEKTLYAVAEDGVHAIDTASLRSRSFLAPGLFVDIALSPDGQRLYLLNATGRWMLAFDARSAAFLGQVDVGGFPQAIVAVDAQ